MVTSGRLTRTSRLWRTTSRPTFADTLDELAAKMKVPADA
jgi:hypothetical protein